MNWVVFWWLVLALFVVNLFYRILKLPRERRWRVAIRETLIMILLYCGMMAMLVFMERGLIFVPTTAEEGWREPGALKVEDIWLEVPCGSAMLRCHGWWCPKPDATFTVLYCHGNAGNLSGRIEQIELWQRLVNANVFIFDYPGYGRSGGEPTEETCQASAKAAYNWLTKARQIEPNQIILYGKSLGGAMAVDLACTVPHRALVLYSAFSSIPDMAQKMLPFFPARWLVRTQFDNLAKLKGYHGLLFVGHGDADDLVPVEHGKMLHDAAGSKVKTLSLFPGRGHGGPPEEFFTQVAEILRATAPTTPKP